MLTLDPHQLVGADFMASRASALNFDEAGFGKTATAIVAADKARLRRLLIVCPTVVKEHWRREFKRFSIYDRSIEIIEGFPKHISTADVVITSHAGVTRSQHLPAFPGPWEGIIVDEAHMARNWGSKLSQNLMGTEPNALWKHTSAFWPLTGSPVVNSAYDLYPYVASSVSRELPKSFTAWDFVNEFTNLKRNFRGEMIPHGVKNEEQLWEMLRPFYIRRMGTLDIGLRTGTMPLKIADVDLKPIMVELEGINPLEIEQWILDDIDVRDAAIARVRHAMGIAKADNAAQYIKYLVECLNVGPIVAFFIHTKVRERVVLLLKAAGLRVAFADGKTTEDIQQLCDQYQDGKIDVFLIQYITGGTGLTLTRGNRVVAIEMPWTAVALEQAINRVRRKTQTQTVFADILFAEDCWLEAVQARIIEEKLRTANRIFKVDHTLPAP